ncbi:MAG: penicillin-binding protein 1B [Halieaceae bacterium]|jgi:penicillin-binding protein 1B|nr:penicillin-binding protein 1B [Halieaceae bacterium]
MTKTNHLLPKLALSGLMVAALAAIYLDAKITTTFTAKMYELPATVYARPLELFVGADISAADLAYELDLLGYRNVARPGRAGEVRQRGGRFDIFARGFTFADERESARSISLSIKGGRVVSLTGAGRDLGLTRLDPVTVGGIYPKHGGDRVLVRLQDVPENLSRALLAVEDRKFYRHRGFSFTGIMRAALSNFQSGRVVAGGSTITQQLVKNYYLTPERTLVRKVKEVLMAIMLELHFSKEQILESYINEVYLGQEGPRGIHGFALAARHYFDKPLDKLGLHQQALLVGMIKGPSLYNPLRNPQRAGKRRAVVLDVMVDQDIISAEHATVAKAMPLGLSQQRRLRNSYPGYLDLVRRQLRREYREEDLGRLGLRIFTALDPLVQNQLERSTAAVMDQLDSGTELQTATVVTRFDTGEVAAMVGGRRVRYAGFNRALNARRPAGSLLKPAVYLAALEQPRRYTLATLLEDSSVTVAGPDGQRWQPRNFDRQSHGMVPLHQALSKSYNLATARLGMELGLERVVDILHRLGIAGHIPQVPSLTLGAGEYSPLDMAAMYQTIAAGGFQMPLRSIRDIVDARDVPLKRYPLEYDRTVSLKAVHLLHYSLRGVVREGTGRGVYQYLDKDFQVAGKTGTTNNGRDSWFAGFSGDLLAVSWIGHDDNSGTGLTGSSGALKLWSHFMANASKRSLSYRMPDGMKTHWIENKSGKLTGEGCPDARMLPFITGSEPRHSTGCKPRGAGILDWFQSLFRGR